MNDETLRRYQFRILEHAGLLPPEGCRLGLLINDDWDDWFEFSTQYQVVIFDSTGVRHAIGNVKIGQSQMQTRRAILPNEFFQLDPPFFSLGQDPAYYDSIRKLGDEDRVAILTALRDMAYEHEIWRQFRSERVALKSLLRFVAPSTVEEQFRRIAHGGAMLTKYSFSYTPPKREGGENPLFKMDFSVEPESKPPTNVHVLIGRNGVGKTRLLGLMTKSLVSPDPTARQSGHFSWGIGTETGVTNVVSVSFSAFDETELLPETNKQDRVQYSYIGLRRKSSDPKSLSKPKSPAMLATEFWNSLEICRRGTMAHRWEQALRMLESDPVFHEVGLTQLLQLDFQSEETKPYVLKTFSLLSSGHKIVLLTITRLIEKVAEKTLVLIDEPEAHLHPPLLASFVRALSKLLVDRNGVAIIATHSPVVLQEVPGTCAWVLSRIGAEAKAERPSIETFGENVGVLTQEVFRLELTRSGFYQMLKEESEVAHSFEVAVNQFRGQLGAEARAILRALYLNR